MKEDDLLKKLRDNDLYKLALRSTSDSEAEQIREFVESFIKGFAADLAPFIDAVTATSGSSS